MDFVEKVKDINMEEDESVVQFDVKSLFTCVSVDETVEVVHQKLQGDLSLRDRTTLNSDHVCLLLKLCLQSTYFTYKGQY